MAPVVTEIFSTERLGRRLIKRSALQYYFARVCKDVAIVRDSRKLVVIGLSLMLSLFMLSGVAAANRGSGPERPEARGFHSGVVLNVDGEDYYFIGPPIEEGADELDVPGHEWVVAGPNRVVGKHYNTGPFGAPQWWSSDAPDGELLYLVDGIIDTWTEEKADWYAENGYVHYHMLVSVDEGELHPDKVVWLKHTARTFFTLDGGPPHHEGEHWVTPGIDYEFMPNYMVEYEGEPHH